MKKSIRFLLPILAISCSSLFGCENGKDNRTLLTYGNIHMNQEDIYDVSKSYIYDINYTTLKDKIENKKENFMIAVSAKHCVCWSNLASVINQYMETYNVICYRITEEEFKNKDTFGIDVVTGNSSIALINNGDVRLTMCTSSNKKELRDYSSFETLMNKYIKLPKMYFIDEDDLNSQILERPYSQAAVYFMRSECGDCKEIGTSILKGYFEQSSSDKLLYVLDCQSFYKTSDDPNYQDYLDKKDELYLAENSNPNFGYQTGVFPTFMYFEESTPKAGAVAYNDTIEKINSKYKVSDSYYSEARKSKLEYLNTFTGTSVIEGIEIPSNQISENRDYITWDYEYQNTYYKPLIEAFLNYSLEKTNLNLTK